MLYSCFLRFGIVSLMKFSSLIYISIDRSLFAKFWFCFVHVWINFLIVCWVGDMVLAEQLLRIKVLCLEFKTDRITSDFIVIGYCLPPWCSVPNFGYPIFFPQRLTKFWKTTRLSRSLSKGTLTFQKMVNPYWLSSLLVVQTNDVNKWMFARRVGIKSTRKLC